MTTRRRKTGNLPESRARGEITGASGHRSAPVGRGISLVFRHRAGSAARLAPATAALVLALTLAAVGSYASGAPLEEADRQAFTVTAKDSLKTLKGKRYVRSNETELQLFLPHIKNLGQGYVGVGADQNYTLIAMADSSHVWLMDYDPYVVRLHFIYRALTLESESAAELVALWPRSEQVLQILRKHYGGSPRLPYLTWLYKRFRTFLAPYLRWSLNRQREGAGTTWLSNRAYYARMRKLWQEGRIQPLPGDLHGSQVWRGICSAAQKLRVNLRIVYLSNAEMYLPYSKGFIANMQAIPHDERSLVVRTVRGKYEMRADRWHYNIQPVADFQRRLSSGRYRTIHQLMRDFLYTPLATRRPLMRPRGFSRFTPKVLDHARYVKRLRRRRGQRARP